MPDVSRFSDIGRYWQCAERSPNICTATLLMQANVKIFPCREGGPDLKAPYTARGYHAASINPVMREIWSRDYPDAGWGVPCAPNNIIVLDADRHGDADGVASLFALFQRYQFDHRSVPAVTTPNNGMHFYFKRPAGLGQTRGTLCRAVDIRDKAYVIAPGCRMADGRVYRLVEGTIEQFAGAIGTQSLAEPPEWMLPMLIHPPRPQRTISPTLATADEETLKNQIRGILKALLRAEQGTRNKLLYWAACRLGEMILTEIITYELAEALLERAGEELGLSAREIRSTIASGLRKAREGDRNAC